ncbi:MAG: hypothetical protein NC517_06685 [Firmicutes bacterium]|nr:hypothetical protein [Bacillota bacterium]
MFNLIKMNLYRLFRQKSFYVLLGTAVLIGWFMVFMIWMTPRLEEQAEKAREQRVQNGGQTEDMGFHVGVVVGMTEGEGLQESAPRLEEFNVTEFMDEYFTAGFPMILISVGAAIIANGERKRGFIKNLGGQMKPRGMLPLSKLPAILLEIAGLYGVTVLSFVLFGRIYFEKFTMGSLSAMCRAMGAQLVLGLAFGAIILLISTAARNAASGIIAGIIVASGLFPYVYFFINRVAKAYFGASENFDISRCSLDYYISCVTSKAAGKEIAVALMAGAVYLVLASAAGWFVMEKRDIV